MGRRRQASFSVLSSNFTPVFSSTNFYLLAPRYHVCVCYCWLCWCPAESSNLVYRSPTNPRCCDRSRTTKLPRGSYRIAYSPRVPRSTLGSRKLLRKTSQTLLNTLASCPPSVASLDWTNTLYWHPETDGQILNGISEIFQSYKLINISSTQSQNQCSSPNLEYNISWKLSGMSKENYLVIHYSPKWQYNMYWLQKYHFYPYPSNSVVIISSIRGWETYLPHWTIGLTNLCDLN